MSACRRASNSIVPICSGERTGYYSTATSLDPRCRTKLPTSALQRACGVSCLYTKAGECAMLAYRIVSIRYRRLSRTVFRQDRIRRVAPVARHCDTAEPAEYGDTQLPDPVVGQKASYLTPNCKARDKVDRHHSTPLRLPGGGSRDGV